MSQSYVLSCSYFDSLGLGRHFESVTAVAGVEDVAAIPLAHRQTEVAAFMLTRDPDIV